MSALDPTVIAPDTLADGSPSVTTIGVQQNTWPSSKKPSIAPDQTITDASGQGTPKKDQK